jgi:hypothetical protein
MADTAASEIDPQVVDDLRVVEQGIQTLGNCGTRAEFWEVFTLLKTGRDAFQKECERLSGWVTQGMKATLDPGLAEQLAKIKTDLYPLARRLRELLGKAPGGILDGMKQDLALVFLMGSAKARQSVSRWVADPAASAAESTLRLKILSRLVDSYRRALLDSRKQGALPPTGPDTTVRSMSPAPPKLKADFVDDLRYVDRCRKLFDGKDPAPAWDLVCLILMQRNETRREIDELSFLKKNGKPGEFAGSLHRLRTQLKEVRAQFDSVALPVGAYLKTIFGSFGGGVDELALAFLVASSQGRHRARQWLDDPELCRGEATASMNGLRSRAARYLDEVKKERQTAVK